MMPTLQPKRGSSGLVECIDTSPFLADVATMSRRIVAVRFSSRIPCPIPG
jgi:hypothetical protein